MLNKNIWSIWLRIYIMWQQLCTVTDLCWGFSSPKATCMAHPPALEGRGGKIQATFWPPMLPGVGAHLGGSLTQLKWHIFFKLGKCVASPPSIFCALFAASPLLCNLLGPHLSMWAALECHLSAVRLEPWLAANALQGKWVSHGGTFQHCGSLLSPAQPGIARSCQVLPGRLCSEVASTGLQPTVEVKLGHGAREFGNHCSILSACVH